MSFPLYSNLVSELEKNEVNISNDNINNFIAFIKVADKQCIELIYALIKKYDIEHENSNDLLPYKGKQLKTGYKFDFESFPIDLQKILIMFYKNNEKKDVITF